MAQSKSQTQLLKRYLSGPLGAPSYSMAFHYLLWIEECQMNRDIRMYDMEQAELFESEKYIALKSRGPGEAAIGAVWRPRVRAHQPASSRV